jgi:hypothetical protein
MTLQRIHLANSGGRDATVLAVSSSPAPPPANAKDGVAVTFRRYVAAGEGLLDGDLQARFDGAYDKQLVDGDPEVDMEAVGRLIDTTQSVLIASTGDPLYCAPEIVEVTLSPSGEETERRAPVDTPSNVNDAIPIAWTGRLIPKAEMVRKFVVRRTMQVRHVDGVTFDFLRAMAADLAEKDSVVLIGAGEGGKGPLLFQLNGSPYRGFLEGRVDGERYQLLLHLSNMELKRPAPKQADAAEGAS